MGLTPGSVVVMDRMDSVSLLGGWVSSAVSGTMNKSMRGVSRSSSLMLSVEIDKCGFVY